MKSHNKPIKHKKKNLKKPKPLSSAARKRLRSPLILIPVLIIAIVGFYSVRILTTEQGESKQTQLPANMMQQEPAPPAGKALTTEQEFTQLKEEELELVQEIMSNFAESDDSYMLMGNFYRRHGNSEEAVKLWEKSLTINPKRYDAYRSIGQLALEKGEPDMAIKSWRKLLEINPDMPGVHSDIAHALIDAGEYKQAIVELEEEIKISPLSSHTSFMFAQSYLQLKEYDNARKYYETTIELEPKHTHAYHGLSTLYMRLKQPDQAQKYIAIFRDLKSKELDAHMSRKPDVIADLTSLRQGITKTYLEAEKIYRTKGNAKRVEELLIRASQLEPTNTICIERLASLYRMTNRIPDALSQFEKIRMMQPENPFCYLNIGILSIQLKRFDNAEKAFQKAIELAPKKSSGYRHLAHLYLRINRKLVEARKLAETATDLEATADNYFVLSWACDMNGDTASALSAIEEAIKLDPVTLKYRQVYYNLKGRN
jgi:tetratricopeptide (TPR) repeat protein